MWTVSQSLFKMLHPNASPSYALSSALGAPFAQSRCGVCCKCPCALALQRLVYSLSSCPGTDEELRNIRDSLKPHINGTSLIYVCDKDNSIAKAIGASIQQMGLNMIVPCFFELTRNLEVGWKQVGRGPTFFGHEHVLKFVEYRLHKSMKTFTEGIEGTEYAARTLSEQLDSNVVATEATLLGPELLQDVLGSLLPKTQFHAATVCREWRNCIASTICTKVLKSNESFTEHPKGIMQMEDTAQSLKQDLWRLQAMSRCLSCGTTPVKSQRKGSLHLCGVHVVCAAVPLAAMIMYRAMVYGQMIRNARLTGIFPWASG